MSLVGADYGSDSDIEDMFQDEPSEETAKGKRSSEMASGSGSDAKKQKKLPSAAALLEDWVPPEEDLDEEQPAEIDRQGTKYNAVAPPETLIHNTIRESYERVKASKDREKRRKENEAKRSSKFVPPQIKGNKANTVTEDYAAWNTKKTATKLR